jgi:hypothetical protein
MHLYFIVLNSPNFFGTTARKCAKTPCDTIVIDVCALNGKALTKTVAPELLTKFWIALGFDPWMIKTKDSEVCFLQDINYNLPLK